MHARLLNLWDNFRSGFWFVPILCVLLATAFGFGMPVLDSQLGSWVNERVPWVATTPAAARSSLSAIGGAMITVTGVVFSITVVTLSITSSQFGSRVLRSFMDDQVTQVSIGLFIGTSIYCFLMMRAVREIDGTAFIPHLSVALSVLLAMVSTTMLIYFIHHVALAIQAPKLVAAVAADLDASINRLFPEKISEPPEDDSPSPPIVVEDDESDTDPFTVNADREGYLQAVDAEGLIEIACEHDLVIELTKRPGDFVVRDVPVARVRHVGDDVDEIASGINDTLIVGSRRTPRQDVLCAVDEIVEVAVRALSPGINDPFTAVTCIDRLGATIGRLARRRIPSPYRYDHEGQLRLIAQPIKFEDVLDCAFTKIREYGRTSASVMQHLMSTLETILQQTQQPADRQAVIRQAEMVLEGFSMVEHQECDRQRLEVSFNRLSAAVVEPGHVASPDSDGDVSNPGQLSRQN